MLFPWAAPRLMNVRNPWLWLGICMLVYLLPPVWVIWQHQYGVPFTGLLQRLPLFRVPEFFGGILAYALFKRAHQAGIVLSATARRAMVLFIVACFLIATVLFTHGPKYWYFLLHNGLLLPSQLMLLYLCALARNPDSAWLRHWSPRLGAASLSMFALHVPLYNLFITLEQLVRGAPGQCFNQWSDCVAAAANVQLSLTGYALFLVLTVTVCVLFQEQFVVRVRKRLVARFITPPAAAHAGKTAVKPSGS